MIARLLIAPIAIRVKEIQKILASLLGGGGTNHPDVLYFPTDSKLGILEARKIKNHFSLKPYSASGRIVVLEDASVLTADAQNALLKTLEELPDQAAIILGAGSDSKFLPTVLSRVQTVILRETKDLKTESRDSSQARNDNDIERLLKSTIEDRFEYIEKLKEKQEFLNSMIVYFHKKLPAHKDFAKELLQAEEWANSNVNIRAILEYLWLIMPRVD